MNKPKSKKQPQKQKPQLRELTAEEQLRDELSKPFPMQRHEPNLRREPDVLALGLEHPELINRPDVVLAAKAKDSMRLAYVSLEMGQYKDAFKHLDDCESAVAQLSKEVGKSNYRAMTHIQRMRDAVAFIRSSAKAAQDAGIPAIALTADKSGQRKWERLDTPYDPNKDE